MTDLARRSAIASAIGVLSVAAVVVAARVEGGDGGDPGGREARTDRWRQLRPSPLERTEVTAARIRRHIYVVGGFERASGGDTTNAVARYSIKRDRWKLAEPMPIGVNHAAATAHRGRLYVHGGYSAEQCCGGAVPRLYRYLPRRDRWKRLPDSETPRAASALGAIGDKLYAAGGANSSSDRLTSLEIYDISDREWKMGPQMSVGRNHVAGAVADRDLFVFGGRPGNLAVTERFDPKRRRWKTLASMGTPRSGFAAATVRGRIAVFGGETSSGTIEQVELFDPAANRWTELPDMRTARHGLGGTARKRRVFSLEGGPRPGGHFSDANEFLDVPKRLVK